MDDLDTQARRFAEETSNLLNRTVTDGVRVKPLTMGSNSCIGAGIGKARGLDPIPIPMAHSKRRPRVWLYLVHYYVYDPEQVFLTMKSSIYSLYTSPQMESGELIVSIDYAREVDNAYPGAHLHVAGDRGDLSEIYRGDRKSRVLRDLHFPVGGRRYRPTLEDLIEFIVTEEMADPKDGWEEVLKEHRKGWFDIQLKAAVRRDREVAAEQLRGDGWIVTPPPDGD